MDTQNLKTLALEDVIEILKRPVAASRTGYLAMYTSWLGGIVKDPELMFVPVDDHVVHRGDGVFEAIKCVGRQVYGLDRHLDRLMLSASAVSLTPPHSQNEIRNIALTTLKRALEGSEITDAMIRLYVTRGPGGFTTNPYESVGAQLYLVITKYKPMGEEAYGKGVSVRVSRIGVKEGLFANVKSCNYLPNVLMKKEALDWGVDFTVSKDENGFLAEGSTENFAIVNAEGELVVPGFERTLKGVTAVRVMELALEGLKSQPVSGALKKVRNGHLRIEDVFTAKEAFMLGTTLDVLPVTSFEGRPIGEGTPGPIAKHLLSQLLQDMKSGPLATSV